MSGVLIVAIIECDKSAYYYFLRYRNKGVLNFLKD